MSAEALPDTAEGTKVSVGCKRAEQEESKLETAKEGLSGGPVVRTLPSSAGATVPSLVRELRSHMPWGPKKPKQNKAKANAVTNSTKD